MMYLYCGKLCSVLKKLGKSLYTDMYNPVSHIKYLKIANNGQSFAPRAI